MTLLKDQSTTMRACEMSLPNLLNNAKAFIRLRAHHIVALSEDQEHINEALAAIPWRQKRPKLVHDCRPSFSTAASDGSTRESSRDGKKLVVQAGSLQYLRSRQQRSIRAPRGIPISLAILLILRRSAWSYLSVLYRALYKVK